MGRSGLQFKVASGCNSRLFWLDSFVICVLSPFSVCVSFPPEENERHPSKNHWRERAYPSSRPWQASGGTRRLREAPGGPGAPNWKNEKNRETDINIKKNNGFVQKTNKNIKKQLMVSCNKQTYLKTTVSSRNEEKYKKHKGFVQKTDTNIRLLLLLLLLLLPR